MIPVLTSAQSKALDTQCEAAGISGFTLMETAARSAVTECPLFENPSSILLVCGNGNNGGDGFAMARMLHERHHVTVAASPNEAAMSKHTLANYRRVRDIGLPIISPNELLKVHADVIVDALIGVGGSHALRDPLSGWTKDINAHGAKVVAVDVPTGLDATTGQAHEHAVRAWCTMTMEALKPGLLSTNGRMLCGAIHVVAIGAPTGMAAALTNVFAMEPRDVRHSLAKRRPDVHKFSLGHVVVIAGSAGMRGAAALTAEAALRTGAGLVTLVSDFIHPLLPREVMTAPLQEAARVAGRATVAVAGPGYGRSPDSLQFLAEVLSAIPDVPVVLDADGLRSLPLMHRPLWNVVLTPHQGEFDWICSNLLADEHGVSHPQELATRLGTIIHHKTVPPTTTDGKKTYLCSTGNPGLATAGSGDVLSGIIGGLIAQGVRPLQSAALGAWIHGRAADQIVAAHAQESLIAGDIIRELGNVLA